LSLSAMAQNNVDSMHNELLSRLSNGDSDIVSINIASYLFDETIINKPSLSSEYAAFAIQIARHLDDSIMIGKSKNMLGRSYLHQQNYFMSTRLFFEAYLIFVKNDSKQDLANTLLLWSRVYSKQNNFDIAQSKIKRALSLFREVGDSIGVAETFNVIGTANLYNNNKKAISYFNKALKIFSNLEYDYYSALTFNLLAKAHLDIEKPIIAIDYLNKSIQMLDDGYHEIALADTYIILAKHFSSEKSHQKALIYYNKADILYKKYEYAIKIAESNYLYSHLYFSMQNYALAENYANKVLEYAKTFNNLDLKRKAYKSLKNIAEANNNQTKLNELSYLYEEALIEFYEDQSRKNFSSFEMNIETNTFDKEIELLKAKSDKEKLELSQKQYNKNKLFASTILFLALGFIVFIYFRFRERKKTALSLEKSNLKLKKEVVERKKAELTAVSNQQRYKLLFSESPIGILQFNYNMIITEVNNRLTQIFNINSKDFIKKHINRIFDRKTVSDVANLLYSKSDDLIKTQSEIPTKKGVIFISVTIKKYVIWSNNEKITSGIIIIEDFTEQKKNEHFYKDNILSKQKLLTTIPDNVILVDSDEKIIDIHFPDFPEKEIKVTKLIDIFDEETMVLFRTHIVNVETTKKMAQFTLNSDDKNYLVRIFISEENYLIIIGDFVGEFEEGSSLMKQKDDSGRANSKEEYIKSIKEDIEKQLLPIYQNIQRGLSFIMIKNFAEKVVALGEKHENQQIIEFGEQLIDYVTTFNVTKVNKQLEQFPSFISRFLGFGIKL
ncbi:MAG: tetratricopeptide repeat protein, partial [Bacteroidota bacterium]|nr:tetratricopeptide repeat protein [Bacteroidota bacterium]